MTESTAPAPTSTPAKKATAKKAAAKKAAASPAAETKVQRNLYLPALPEGFDYTSLTVTGPKGETINVAPASGADAEAGSAVLSFEGAGMQREQKFDDMKSAIAAGVKTAKSMHKIAEQEAALAKVREAAFDL